MLDHVSMFALALVRWIFSRSTGAGTVSQSLLLCVTTIGGYVCMFLCSRLDACVGEIMGHLLSTARVSGIEIGPHMEHYVLYVLLVFVRVVTTSALWSSRVACFMWTIHTGYNLATTTFAPLLKFWVCKYTVDVLIPSQISMLNNFFIHASFYALIIRESTLFTRVSEFRFGNPLMQTIAFVRKAKLITHAIVFRAWLQGRLTALEFIGVLSDLNGLIFCTTDGLVKELKDLVQILSAHFQAAPPPVVVPTDDEAQTQGPPPHDFRDSIPPNDSPVLLQLSQYIKTHFGVDVPLQAYSVHVAGTIACIFALSTVVFGSLAPAVVITWVNRNALFLKNFSIVKNTVAESANAFTTLAVDLLGMGSLVPANAKQFAAYRQLTDVLGKLTILENDFRQDAVSTYAQLGQEAGIEKLLSAYTKATFECAQVDMKATSLMNSVYSKLASIRTMMSQFQRCSSTRIEPVVIWLHGQAGTGKTYLTREIIKELSALHGRDLPSWSLAGASKHFDGYAHQPIILMDDYMANPTPESLGMWLQLVSSAVYQVPQADLSNKGMTCTSLYIIVTTNYLGLPPTCSAPDYRAFNRRRHFLVDVEKADGWNDTYVTPRMFSAFPVSSVFYKNDMTEIRPPTKSMMLKDIVRDAFSLHQRFKTIYTECIGNELDKIAAAHQETIPTAQQQGDPMSLASQDLSEANTGMSTFTSEENRQMRDVDLKILTRDYLNGMQPEVYMAEKAKILSEFQIREERRIAEAQEVAGPSLTSPQNYQPGYNVHAQEFMPSGMDIDAEIMANIRSSNQKYYCVGSKVQRCLYWFITAVLPTIILMFGAWTLKRAICGLFSYFSKEKVAEESLKTLVDEKKKCKPSEVYAVKAKTLKILHERSKRKGPLPMTVRKQLSGSSNEEYSSVNSVICESVSQCEKVLATCPPSLTITPNIELDVLDKFGNYLATTEPEIVVRVERRKRTQALRPATGKKITHPVSGDNVLQSVAPVYGEAKLEGCVDPTTIDIADKISTRNTVFFHAYGETTSMVVSALMIADRVGVTVAHATIGYEKFFVVVNGTSYDATVIWSPPNRDLAFFQLERTAPLFANITTHLRTKTTPAVQDYVAGMLAIKRRQNFVYTVGSFCVETVVKAGDVAGQVALPFRILTSYVFSTALTTFGDCGSVYYVLNPGYNQKIVGLHFAGTSTTSFCAPLYHEDYLAAIHAFDEVTPEGLSGDFKWELCHDELEEERTKADFPECTYIGSPCTTTGVQTLVSQPNATRLWRSPFAHPLFPTTAEPAPLSGADARIEGLKRDVLREGIKKWTKASPCEIDHDQLTESTDYVISQVVAACYGSHFSVLSAREALTGTLNIPMSSSVDVTTSGGYRFVSPNGGKSAYIKMSSDKSLDYVTGEPKEKLMGAMHDLITAFSQGEEVPICFKASLKDEIIKQEKVKTGSPRVFAASPLDLMVVQRRYTGAAIWALMQNRRRLPIKVGLAPQSIEWRELYHYMMRVSDRGFCADYKNFDGSIPRLFMLQVPLIYNALYQRYDPHWTEHQNRVRLGMYKNISGPNLVFGRTAMKAPRGNPSGQVGTTIDNCLVNMLIYHYCYSKIMKAHGMNLPFNEHVALAVYGDDNIVTISDEARPIFTFKTMQQQVALLGMTLTPADKNADDCPTMQLKDMTFLKRRFVESEHGEVIGPLENASIAKMLSFTKGDRHLFWKEPDAIAQRGDILSASADSIATELSLFPQETYNTIMMHVQDVLAKTCGIALHVVPWRTQRNVVLHDRNG